VTRLERVLLSLERPGVRGIKLIARRSQATPGKFVDLSSIDAVSRKKVLLSRKTNMFCFQNEKKSFC